MAGMETDAVNASNNIDLKEFILISFFLFVCLTGTDYSPFPE
jgi:hypothetical protein